MNILHKENCPICQSELVVTSEPSFRSIHLCNNKCYRLVIYFDDIKTYYVRVFNKSYKLDYKDKRVYHISKVEENIQDEIKYWKKNERYLIKLLEGNNEYERYT